MSKLDIQHEVLHVESEGDATNAPRQTLSDMAILSQQQLAVEVILETQWDPAWAQGFHRLRDKYHLDLFFAEAVGSFIFLYFLLMSIGGMVVTQGEQGSFGFSVYVLGIAVALAVYVIFPISGSHISPPMTLNAVIFRKFPLKKVPIYIGGQVTGAILAVIFTFAIAEAQLNAAGAIPRPAGSSAVYVPTFNPKVPIGTAIMNELIGDTVFVFITTAVTDLRNVHIAPQFAPMLIGLNLFICANAFGWCYWALNPLRDIIPRAYASQTYSGLFNDGYWAVPLFIPFLGHFLGVFIYELFAAKMFRPETPKVEGADTV
ncbi:hypothetical protein TRVA0_091S00122 [Trichomonascus vanleenenianus]|uniref:uncharacterized protein n=1 Tax=Trichomonascus vanleenenianus TaxID=2268995 RepID=UPI003EC98F7C